MSASIKQQLEDLHKQILELQCELPDSPYQLALQRFQRDLENYRKTSPTPRPLVSLIQPVPPHLRLTPTEMAIWNTFSDYHKALLQDAGGGYYLPREEWLRLADVAADLTTALYEGGYAIVPVFNPPTTPPGLYGWDAASQGWLPAVPAPTQTSGLLAYNAATGLWVPVSPAIGRTDGSSPSAGQVGEVVGVGNSEANAINVPLTYNMVDVSVYTAVTQLTLTAGDWDVEGYATWDCRGITVTGGVSGWAALYQPSVGGETQFAGTAVGIAPAGIPQFTEVAVPTFTSQLTIAASTNLQLVTVVVCSVNGDAGKLAKAWGSIRARRMS